MSYFTLHTGCRILRMDSPLVVLKAQSGFWTFWIQFYLFGTILLPPEQRVCWSRSKLTFGTYAVPLKVRKDRMSTAASVKVLKDLFWMMMSAAVIAASGNEGGPSPLRNEMWSRTVWHPQRLRCTPTTTGSRGTGSFTPNGVFPSVRFARPLPVFGRFKVQLHRLGVFWR
jgi:hypothetical protein